MAKRGVKGRPASFGTSSRFQVRFFYDGKTKSEKLAYKKIKNNLIKVGLKVGLK